MDAVPIRVALRRPYLRRETMYWPVFRMRDWIVTLLSKSPGTLLAGCRLEEQSKWTSTFHAFWEEYKTCNSSHPVFSAGLPLEQCVPYFLHGDEGKTLRSRSMMIESFQPVISRKGPLVSNESGFLEL